MGSELIIPGWKVGDIVRVEFDENGEALPIYRVNGMNGPRFLGKERPEKGKNIMYARISEGSEWEEYLSAKEFRIEESRIVVEVPGEPQIYDFGKDGKEKIENCDVLGRGRATKSQLAGSHPVSPTAQLNIPRQDRDSLSGRDPGEQGVVYVADERGAACDYVTMSELDTRLPYLIRIQGENREGRSLKFFLYNTGSKRNDIEWLMRSQRSQLAGSLPVSPTAQLNIPRQDRDSLSGRDPGVTFDQSFSLLPWSWDGYYTLNIETRSFGQRAENRVEPVEVRYFPLEQIAGARIMHVSTDATASSDKRLIQPISDSVALADGLQFTNNLNIKVVRKTGTWLYGVGVKGQGLIKLSQGYDKGWVGFAVPANNLQFTIYNLQKLEHVKVDGWANGFILRAGEQSSDHSSASLPAGRQGSERGETQMVVIFYWPQILEYFGFGIIGVTGVGLLYKVTGNFVKKMRKEC